MFILSRFQRYLLRILGEHAIINILQTIIMRSKILNETTAWIERKSFEDDCDFCHDDRPYMRFGLSRLSSGTRSDRVAYYRALDGSDHVVFRM